jgi:hypothetical protein
VLFRISRRPLERAAGAGRTPREVIAMLESGARDPVPVNVAHEIHSWMGGGGT